MTVTQTTGRVIFLRGKKVNLRPLRKSTDLEQCIIWINDPDVRRYLLIYFPTSAAEEERWFDSHVDNDNQKIFGIETKDGRLIGVMSLNGINFKDGVATTGAYIGSKADRGKGYGVDAKMTLLNYAFNELNLRKICSEVLGFNKRSLKYNEKCGYRQEGVRRRQIFKEGKYHDEILIAVFKEKWLPLWRKWEKSE